MSRASTGTSRLQAGALALAAAAWLLSSCGLWRGTSPAEPVAPPPSPSGPAAGSADGPGATAPPDAEGAPGSAAPAPTAGPEGPASAAPQAPEGGTGEQAQTPAAVEPALPQPAGAAEGGQTTPAEPKAAATAAPAAESGGKGVEDAAKPRPEATGGPGGAGVSRDKEERPGRVVIARLPDHLAFDRSGPYWTRGREELVYRVEFLGMTMGYARFVFNGKVLLGGHEVYHLSVRAWTASVLRLIYPINDTIDYYMDVKTLEPLRQEYTTGNRKKDDVMIYDQATGKIVYRYKESGEIRKEVNAVPNVYDPVTLAYFIRSRGTAGDEKGRNVYAGRKVWEISAQHLGEEKLATERGEVETIVIRPVIKRDGKVEDKGDLRMWMTTDERKIPVRIYAKFKKIRTWTLVGELLPERKGG